MKQTNLQPQLSDFVFVMTDKCTTCEIDASASPLNPYVVIRVKSAKVDNFEVVKRSASMASHFSRTGRKSEGSNIGCITTDPNTATIVLYLEKLHTAILDDDPDRCCASIQAVLNELLQRSCWPINNLWLSRHQWSNTYFTSSDLINEVFTQSTDGLRFICLFVHERGSYFCPSPLGCHFRRYRKRLFDFIFIALVQNSVLIACSVGCIWFLFQISICRAFDYEFQLKKCL